MLMLFVIFSLAFLLIGFSWGLLITSLVFGLLFHLRIRMKKRWMLWMVILMTRG